VLWQWLPGVRSGVLKVKLPIVDRPSHTAPPWPMRAVLISISNGPEPAVCRRCLACHMGSHSITCHPTQANPFLLYIWEESQTSVYYCCNLPGSESGTNLYFLVDRSTCVNNLPKVVTWQCYSAESNLWPEWPQDYKFGTLPLDYLRKFLFTNL